MKKIYHKIQHIFSNSLTKVLLLLTTPILIVSLFAFSINAYYINTYKKFLISNYSHEINSYLSELEDKIDSIITNIAALSTTEIGNMLVTTESPSSSAALPTIATLSRLQLSESLIDSIYIYNPNANFVITQNGVFDAESFFNSLYAYEKYSYEYWASYKKISGNIYINEPTSLLNTSSAYKKTVVPIVFSSLGNVASSSIVVCNIDASIVYSSFNVHQLTPNTNFFMMDKNETIISDISGSDFFTNHTFIRNVQKSIHSSSSEVEINGKKHLLIQSTSRSNILGYSYWVSIPFSDINTSIATTYYAACVFMLLLYIAFGLFVLYGTKFLYLPFKKLANTAVRLSNPNNFTNSLDTFDYIHKLLLTMDNSIGKLKQDLSATLPHSQKNYLIDILNNNGNINSDLFERLDFKYDFFIAITFSMNINTTFYQNFSVSENINMIQEIGKVIQRIFSNNFITYNLSENDNIFYFLLNVSDDSCINEIDNTIEQVKTLLEVDKEYLDIVFSRGNIYKGIHGLKLTHHESVTSIINQLNSKRINFSSFYNDSTSFFTSSTEDMLYNYLMAGYIEKSKELLMTLFKTTPANSFTIRNNLYADILMTIKKVSREKKLLSLESSIRYILKIIRTNDGTQNSFIEEQITALTDAISNSMQTYTSKIDIADIIEYINHHYCDDIYLDEIAEIYQTTAKYLSKRIKEYLDISYKEYVTLLRINKAKELLETTDKSVNDIFQAVGFQSRVAFTRSFKLKTGLSPSEYKKEIINNSVDHKKVLENE